MKRNQETGNRETNRQTKYCNPRAHARRALTSIVPSVIDVINAGLSVLVESIHNSMCKLTIVVYAIRSYIVVSVYSIHNYYYGHTNGIFIGNKVQCYVVSPFTTN